MKMELKFDVWMILSSYALLNGLLYSLSFWKRFNIDILQYTSFNEILPPILYLIAAPIIFLLLSLASHAFFEITAKTLMTKAYEEGKVPFSDIKKTSKIYEIMLLAAMLTLGNVISFKLLSLKEALIHSFFCFLSMLAYLILYYKTNFFINLTTGRNITIMAICFSPFFSVSMGSIKSYRISNGINTYIIKSDIPCKTSNNEKFRLISSTSDRVFSMSITGEQICIYKYENLHLERETIPKT